MRNTIPFIAPKLVVKNVTKRSVNLMGLLHIKPGKQLDIFKAVSYLPEHFVINALRVPDGDLYKEIALKKSLKLIDIQLVSLLGLPAVYTNAARPKASKFPAGTMIWNSDDKAINFSDGAAWRDAAGLLT